MMLADVFMSLNWVLLRQAGCPSTSSLHFFASAFGENPDAIYGFSV